MRTKNYLTLFRTESKTEITINDSRLSVLAAAAVANKQASMSSSSKLNNKTIDLNKQLPPLPRTPHQANSSSSSVHHPPLQSTNTTPSEMIGGGCVVTSSGSSSSSTSSNPIEFDRSLNVRRSKRFVRQSATAAQLIHQLPITQIQQQQQQQQQHSHHLTAQEISLSPSASSQHVSSVTPSAVGAGSMMLMSANNNLHKAISTPSILDKLKSSISMTTATTTTNILDNSDNSYQNDRNVSSSHVSLNNAVVAPSGGNSETKKNGMYHFCLFINFYLLKKEY